MIKAPRSGMNGFPQPAGAASNCTIRRSAINNRPSVSRPKQIPPTARRVHDVPAFDVVKGVKTRIPGSYRALTPYGSGVGSPTPARRSERSGRGGGPPRHGLALALTRLFLRLDSCHSGRRAEDARVAVVPADAEAWRLLLKHFLDHAPAPGLGDPLGLDHDQVSHLRSHWRLTSLQGDSKADSSSAIMPREAGSRITADDLTRVLDEAGVGYDLLAHVHTIGATAEAEALGLATRDVAKTLIVKTQDGYLRVVLQGSGRLDLRKLRALLDGNKHDVRLASEEDLGH